MSGEALRCAWCGTAILHVEIAVSEARVVGMSEDHVGLEDTGRLWCSEAHCQASEEALHRKRAAAVQQAEREPDVVIQRLAAQIRDVAHLDEIISTVEGGRDMREAVREQLRPYLTFALNDEEEQVVHP